MVKLFLALDFASGSGHLRLDDNISQEEQERKKSNLKITLKNPLPRSFFFTLAALRLATVARGTAVVMGQAPPLPAGD
jgi:hypothetical protein